MDIKKRIKGLRNLMKERGIDAYIIPSSDSHQSEYVAEHFKSRQFISGFTGSAGTVVVTIEDAGLWTDGRYYIQAEAQLKDSGIRLFRAADIGVPSFSDWLLNTLKPGDTVGYDGKVFAVNTAEEMMEKLKSKNIKFDFSTDLIDLLWEDRPELSKEEIFIHEVKFAGKSRVEKLEEVREKMKQLGGNKYLLSSLDDIAWLLNIRGLDIPNNPVAISYAVITKKKCYLFIDPLKVTEAVRNELEEDGIRVRNYNELEEYLKKLDKDDTVILDASKTNYFMYNSINSEANIIKAQNITTKLKAIKNDIEIENLEQCQINDGIAMVRLIKWLKESVGKPPLTEITVGEKLLEFRKEQEYFVEPSFDSIIGYKENAAMMHYKAVPGSEAVLLKEGFLLIDSGGQYYIGTTDTTRTIALGKLTDEEKTDFTLVLKSHIALDRFKFLHGATGSNLDVIARQPMWERGLDYKCGTGHGVGFFLNVHEGPHRIAMAQNDTVLEKNMVITNEPGIYKQGMHGIRTENMVVVVEAEKTECGQFMKFEALTLCPIDLDGIKIEMLNEDEKTWLNSYHEKVYQKLSPSLNEEENAWLREATRAI